MVGGVWNGFLLVESGVRLFFVGSVVHPIVMVTCFGNLPFLLLLRYVKSPEFHDLIRMDKGHWPKCLLWHGWLPMLSGVNGASPWALDASESAGYLVEVALGRYSSGMVAEWSPSDELDGAGAASSMPDHLNVWTDGGAGFFAHQSEECWRGRRWGHVDGTRADNDDSSCGGFCSVPGPLQSVQRAEMWGVILALQSSSAVHLGVDNLGVVRHVGRLLDGHNGSTPFELVNNGDLLLLVQRMLHIRGLDTVRITKVEGHADEAMVLDCRVRDDDKLGNDAADEAANFGRRRVGNAIIDARRNVSGGLWSLVSCQLLILWYGLLVHIPKRRRLVHAVRDRAFLPRHLVFGIQMGGCACFCYLC